MLIGRDSELGVIGGVLERAAAGSSGLVVVRGEAGIGKTALLDEAARLAEGFTVLRAAGFESEAELPYATLHQLLQPLLARLDALPAPQAGALSAAFGLEAREGVDRLLVGLAVLTLLSSESEEQPLLCLVDDVQWIDRGSLDALTFVARRLLTERVASVWALREENGPPLALPEADELRPRQLETAEANRLLLDRHGDRLGRERETVLELAGGNPLALVELADAAARGATGSTTVEQNCRDVVGALPEDTRKLLLTAAADEWAGTSTVAAAAAALGIEIAALEPAERAGLVHVDREALAFRHPLLRTVVYEGATFAERSRVHTTLAEVLAGDEEVDRRAWHRAAATIGTDEDVAGLLEESAARAIARSGYGAAATALERAAALSPVQEDRVRRLVRAAASADLAGQRSRALALLDEVDGPIDDVHVGVEAARVRGVIEAQDGSAAEAIGIFLDAASAAFPVDRRGALDLVTRAQEAAGLSGHPAVHELAAWAERFGDAETTEEEIMLGLVRGFAAIASGDRLQATPALSRAAELGAEVDDPRLLMWAATAAMFMGDEPRTLDLLRRAVEVARSRGAVGALPFALHLLAGVERRLGDIAGAGADAEESRRLALETGQPVVEMGALSTLTALAAFRGDVERAEELAAATRALAQPRGLIVALAGVARALAELDLARGRAAEALATLETVLGGPDLRHLNHPYALFTAPLVVEAAARAGVPERVGPTLDAFEQWAELGRLSWAAPLVARSRALLATEDEAAEALFARTLDLHAATPQAYEIARTQLLYGEFLRRARRKTEARAVLREALTTFESLGARLWAERALGELWATGATARKRDDSTRGELTAQELQVVRLVAQGNTNPEVAAQLFVSPKTVQYHLRKVFAKLGIASRNELTRLVALGEIPGAVAAEQTG